MLRLVAQNKACAQLDAGCKPLGRRVGIARRVLDAAQRCFVLSLNSVSVLCDAIAEDGWITVRDLFVSLDLSKPQGLLCLCSMVLYVVGVASIQSVNSAGGWLRAWAARSQGCMRAGAQILLANPTRPGLFRLRSLCSAVHGQMSPANVLVRSDCSDRRRGADSDRKAPGQSSGSSIAAIADVNVNELKLVDSGCSYQSTLAAEADHAADLLALEHAFVGVDWEAGQELVCSAAPLLVTCWLTKSACSLNCCLKHIVRKQQMHCRCFSI